jgi:hypothetical protein
MEDLIKHLQANAQNIDGVDMVPLSVAIQAAQTASATQVVDSLDKMLADIQQIYTDGSSLDTID